MKPEIKQWKSLVISLLLTLAVGGLAGFATAGSMEKYANLYQPPLAPPGWLFPVVWTILYVLMAVAAWRVFISHSPNKQQALLLYGIQLIVNALWPVLFFTLDAYLLAFAWLLLLWYLVFMMFRQFKEIDPLAGWLIVPYLVWLTFAAYLNLAIAIHYL